MQIKKPSKFKDQVVENEGAKNNNNNNMAVNQ